MILGIFLVLLYANGKRFLDSYHAHIAHFNEDNYADIMGGIKIALDRYQIDNGHYPGNFNDLIQQPNGTTNWSGPYLDGIPHDRWGHNFIYEFPGKHNPSSYDLMSVGPDGKEGTSDDIGNW
jgi:general secretion pathway protein G